MRTLSNQLSLPGVLACFLMLSGQPAATPVDSTGLTYRRTVSEVRLTFFAADARHGTPSNLSQDDFAVVDNDLIVRSFRSFTRSDEINLDVVVLVDRSESVLSRFHEEIADVLQLMGRTSWIADDKLSIISFGGDKTTVVCEGDCRTPAAADRLWAMKASGDTPLFDALEFASAFVTRRRNPGVRPVILLYSDGQDTISAIGMRDAMQKIAESEAQVYVVDTNRSNRYAQGTGILRVISDSTAGRYFSISDTPAGILAAVLDDLRNGYAVSYSLPNHVYGFHSLRILPTRNLNLRFRCREGYFYNPAQPKETP